MALTEELAHAGFVVARMMRLALTTSALRARLVCHLKTLWLLRVKLVGRLHLAGHHARPRARAGRSRGKGLRRPATVVSRVMLRSLGVSRYWLPDEHGRLIQQRRG